MVATVDRFCSTEKRTTFTVAFAASLPEALFSGERLATGHRRKQDWYVWV